MKSSELSFSVRVDVANPGQFFACCGLLEVAHRLWPGAEGWFWDEDGVFRVAAMNCQNGLSELIDFLQGAKLRSDDDTADDKTCPLRLQGPSDTSSSAFRVSLRLDWWRDNAGVGGSLKTWAGQQRVTVISRAMLHATVSKCASDMSWFDCGAVARDPDAPSKVVEPFYFDARRYAHALDVGFSLDAIQAHAIAYPSVELMALIGLQRFRPRRTGQMFHYFAWADPLGVAAAAAVTCGTVSIAAGRGYRFRLQYRDDQKRYKAFGFASRIGGSA